ncbi:uracil-DNA glycosylase-like protein [Lipomyces oligophaga]|uniref:uracil-DNA glycosylase-like protein n=1 Tax=Lipomyces oligophaga TaxID=45792 RepID=UPI0034CFF046
MSLKMISKRKLADDVSSAGGKRIRPITAFLTSQSVPKSSSMITKNVPDASKFDPATEPRTTNLGSAGFDKQKWVDSLTSEQRELLALEIHTMDDSWLAVLHAELTKAYFLKLKRFLIAEDKAGEKILPPAKDVYSWSRLTPLDKVKVVILGQDPYHNFNQAHGLAFSVLPPTPTPPSLRNIFISLKNDYPEFVPPANKLGDLTPWAERGVLLLNTCLTVRAHSANSHAGKGWEQFTEKVISVVAENRSKGVVFLAWGSPAGKRIEKIDKRKHCILRSVHPSPLSASRGFFDCQHFLKTNEWLAMKYGPEAIIDWKL